MASLSPKPSLPFTSVGIQYSVMLKKTIFPSSGILRYRVDFQSMEYDEFDDGNYDDEEY